MSPYSKREAKAYAREHFRGVWAATMIAFGSDMAFDEAGFQANLEHWIGALKLGGLLVTGKQGEHYAT